ncbi:MAG: NUDIX domain-containing protein [Lachnospiraceae bacterium]|nr:NUDIX domain-containing protein [Lachnospiraceae bacterium]
MGRFRILVKGIVQYKDSYLAVERWYDDRIVEPYQWEFIDGEMEFGETPERAVQRIVEEKAGVPVQVDKPLYTWGFSAGEICTIGIAFLCDAQTDQVVLSEELHRSRWVPKDKIGQVISNQAVVKDIEKAGLLNSFELDDFGKVDLFIEPMD